MDDLADAIKELRAGIDDFGSVAFDELNKHVDKLSAACDRAERYLAAMEEAFPVSSSRPSHKESLHAS